MNRWLRLLLILALLLPGRAHAQEIITSRVLSVPAGAIFGMIGGGYLTVAVIVAEARMGRYIHDLDDVTGWRSVPAVTGFFAGLGLGIWSPARLESTILYGAGGALVGTALGLGIGWLIWDPPEGKWAGGAIGGGVGLIIGNTIGILNPIRSDDAEAAGSVRSEGVPVMIRIRF